MSTQSVIERLRQLVLMHQANEEPHIEKYRELAERTTDPLAEFVFNAIADDEERHHEVMSTLVRRLTIEMEKGGAVHRGDKGLLTDVAELAEHEAFGVKRLNEIAEEYKTVDGGLASALLRAIAKDSEKHDGLLHFVEDRANNT